MLKDAKLRRASTEDPTDTVAGKHAGARKGGASKAPPAPKTLREMIAFLGDKWCLFIGALLAPVNVLEENSTKDLLKAMVASAEQSISKIRQDFEQAPRHQGGHGGARLISKVI